MNFSIFCGLFPKIDVTKWKIIMDNAANHKHSMCKLLYSSLNADVTWLPPYSPDYNPIENLFGWIKKFMKNFFLMDINCHDAVAAILTYFVTEKQLDSTVLKSVEEWLTKKI